MKKIFPAIILFVFISLQMPNQIQGAMDGEALYKGWLEYRKNEQSLKFFEPDRSFFIGFVIGVIDALSGIEFSLEPNMNYGQFCSIVGKYLENYPKKRNYDAVKIIVYALKETLHNKWR